MADENNLRETYKVLGRTYLCIASDDTAPVSLQHIELKGHLENLQRGYVRLLHCAPDEWKGALNTYCRCKE